MSDPIHCVCGIDPGVTGSIAFYWTRTPHRVVAEPLPVVNNNVDAATLAARIRQMMPTIAVIEQVGSMPGQGVASTFRFGRAYGTLVGVVQTLQIPLYFVTPSKWKKHFGLPADKERARELALREFSLSPEHFARKMDHGNSEAALIALYGAQVILEDASTS